MPTRPVLLNGVIHHQENAQEAPGCRTSLIDRFRCDLRVAGEAGARAREMRSRRDCPALPSGPAIPGDRRWRTRTRRAPVSTVIFRSGQPAPRDRAESDRQRTSTEGTRVKRSRPPQSAARWLTCTPAVIAEHGAHSAATAADGALRQRASGPFLGILGRLHMACFAAALFIDTTRRRATRDRTNFRRSRRERLLAILYVMHISRRDLQSCPLRSRRTAR